MKNTPLLQAVKTLFENQTSPLSVPSIQYNLKAMGLAPNKTSLYRLLKKMEQEEIVRRVQLESPVTHYEVSKKDHPHFSCQECESVQCVNDKELQQKLKKLLSTLGQKGLKVKSQHFSLSGLCAKCNHS